MRCQQCQAPNRDGAQFCRQCGTRLESPCPACGAAVEPESRFCDACGAAVQRVTATELSRFASPESYTPRHLAEKILTSRAALEGERKQVTVLFCDIAGSTALAERIGPEAMHGLLNRFFELALAEVHRHEGTINQFLGDGFMALFGAPLAHENHARCAAFAALGIREALQERRAEVGGAEGVRLTVRIGLNTGFVVVGKIGDNLRMDYTAIGDTSHLAARLQQVAEPGIILAAEATHRLVEVFVESTYAGTHEIKGKAEPQRVYRLEARRPGAARFDAARRRGLTRFVGRERELDTLERSWRETRAGTLRVVNVVGEAGIGKSRLVYELRQRLEGQSALLLQGHCVADGRSTPFLPFIEVVRTAFRIGADDVPAETARRLSRGLETLGLKPGDHLPFLLNLLGLPVEGEELRGLDGVIIGARTREALQEMLRERCRLSPVLMFIDDLHWIDTASAELITRVVRHEPSMPLLFVGACRPEYRPPWTQHAGVSELRLGPLSEEGCAHLVRNRLETDDAPRDLVGFVIEKAEGNPLFAEEIIQYLLESGTVCRSAAGFVFSGSPDGGSVPGTLGDLIMARVDRVTDDHRTLLQVASVIGRRFPVDVLREALQVNGTVVRLLRDLEEQELVFRQEAGGLEEYRFKHALIQDAIYQSLLAPRQAELHERVAEAIERLHAGRLGEWAEVLAHHYGRTRRADKSVRYLALAGEKSLRVYAVEEAHECFRRVVELSEAVPDCADDVFLADVLLAWARAYYYRKDNHGLVELERYLPRVEALGDGRQLSLFLFWLGFAHVIGARGDAARPLLERALALGETLGDEECIGFACMGLMWLYMLKAFEAPHDTAERFGRRGLEIAERLGDVYLASKCLLGLSQHLGGDGRFAEAHALAKQILDVGRRASDPRATAMGFYKLAGLDIWEERFEEAIENAEEALRISPDPLDRLVARAFKGLCLAFTGRSEDGLRMVREVFDEFEAAGAESMLGFFEVPYGAAIVLSGEMAAGVRAIEAGIQRAAGWGTATLPALGHMVLGEVYLHMVLGDRKPPVGVVLRNLWFILRALPLAGRRARSHLEEAARRARQVGMPGVLARSLLGLGLLSRAKGRIEEARRYLHEARALAEPLGSPLLDQRIRAALSALPA